MGGIHPGERVGSMIRSDDTIFAGIYPSLVVIYKFARFFHCGFPAFLLYEIFAINLYDEKSALIKVPTHSLTAHAWKCKPNRGSNLLTTIRYFFTSFYCYLSCAGAYRTFPAKIFDYNTEKSWGGQTIIDALVWEKCFPRYAFPGQPTAVWASWAPDPCSRVFLQLISIIVQPGVASPINCQVYPLDGQYLQILPQTPILGQRVVLLQSFLKLSSVNFRASHNLVKNM